MPRSLSLPFLLAAAFLLLPATALAQSPDPGVPAETSSTAPSDAPGPEERLPAVFEKPLLLIPAAPPPPPAIPEPRHRLRYMITDGDPDSLYRLTVKEKFLLALQHSVALEGHGGNIFLSAIQQAADTQPHYQQGWDGYGQRILASEGYKTASSLITIGALSSLMKTDPRFIRLGRGTVGQRLWYAARRTVVTRRDSGGSTFNLPFVLGQLAAGSVALSYYPERDRSAGAVFESWGLHLLYNSGFNCLREFSPLILRLVIPRRKHKTDSSLPQPPPSSPVLPSHP